MMMIMMMMKRAMCVYMGGVYYYFTFNMKSLGRIRWPKLQRHLLDSGWSSHE